MSTRPAATQRRYGGLVLILLSVGLLLFGGGFFPPLIGIIGGLTGTRINKPLTRSREHSGGNLSRWLAWLYPWVLIVFLLQIFGQIIVGRFYNNWLMTYMSINVLLILGFLLLSVVSALAHDVQRTVAIL